MDLWIFQHDTDEIRFPTTYAFVRAVAEKVCVHIECRRGVARLFDEALRNVVKYFVLHLH